MIQKGHHIKRFCFAVNLQWLKSRDLSCLSKPNINSEKSSGIENVSVFKNDAFVFVMLETQPQSDLTTLKSHLKNQSETSIQIKLLKNILFSEDLKQLEKIFKMPSEENNTIKEANYKRIVMTLELNSDEALLESYKEIHKATNIWPEIIHNMKTVGVKDMEIYLHGNQAFLIMDTISDFDLQKDGEIWANLPREKEWQAYVGKFQKVDPKSKATEKWKVMTLLK